MKADWARKYAVSVQPVAEPYDWICVRRMLREHAAEVTMWLEHESIFDLNPDLRRELKDPPGTYERKGATVLLARLDRLCTGMVLLKRLDGDTAELGRLYTRPSGKKAGAERVLLEAALATAYDRGIRRIVLDKVTALTPAVTSLLESAGATSAATDRGRVQLVLDRVRSSTNGDSAEAQWRSAQTAGSVRSVERLRASNGARLQPATIRSSDVLAHPSANVHRGARDVAGALAQ